MPAIVGTTLTEFWWLSLPSDGAAYGAPAGTEVVTPSASAVSIGSAINASLSVTSLAVTVTDFTADLAPNWTAQTPSEPVVLSAP